MAKSNLTDQGEDCHLGSNCGLLHIAQGRLVFHDNDLEAVKQHIIKVCDYNQEQVIKIMDGLNQPLKEQSITDRSILHLAAEKGQVNMVRSILMALKPGQ